MINKSILAKIRYWQGKPTRYWRPILAGLAILAAASLACFAPSWAPTQVPSASPTAGPSQTEETFAPSVSTLPAPLRARVTAIRALNVREDPSERSAGLGTLLSGQSVVLSGKCSDDPEGWAQIRYKSGFAWVKARYISGDLCEEE